MTRPPTGAAYGVSDPKRFRSFLAMSAAISRQSFASVSYWARAWRSTASFASLKHSSAFSRYQASPDTYEAPKAVFIASLGRLLVGRVERSTRETVDRYVVNLPVLGLHQQRPAVPTKKIDGVVAG